MTLPGLSGLGPTHSTRSTKTPIGGDESSSNNRTGSTKQEKSTTTTVETATEETLVAMLGHLNIETATLPETFASKLEHYLQEVVTQPPDKQPVQKKSTSLIKSATSSITSAIKTALKTCVKAAVKTAIKTALDSAVPGLGTGLLMLYEHINTQGDKAPSTATNKDAAKPDGISPEIAPKIANGIKLLLQESPDLNAIIESAGKEPSEMLDNLTIKIIIDLINSTTTSTSDGPKAFNATPEEFKATFKNAVEKSFKEMMPAAIKEKAIKQGASQEDATAACEGLKDLPLAALKDLYIGDCSTTAIQQAISQNSK